MLTEKIKSAFTFEKSICRLIAAWCTFAAIVVFGGDNFYELKFAQDFSLGIAVALIVVFFLIYTAVAARFSSYNTDSWFLFIPVTVCIIKWISDYNNSKNSFLFIMAIIVAYILFVLYFVTTNKKFISGIKPGNKTTAVIIIVLGLISGTVIAVVTCLRYVTFSTPNYDFGLFCNMFYYMKKTGLPLVTSERDRLLSHFAVHISPIYYLILPFYCLFPSPLTLQIAQAVIVASAIAPVALIAKKYGLSNKMVILVSLLFALYPAASCGCFYDLHENCFLLPLLLWMFYFFEKEKYIPMGIFALSVLCVKEDAAIYVLFFAIYVIFARKKYMQGTIMAAVSLIYFGIAIYLLQSFGTGAMVNRYDNLIFDKDLGLLGAIKTALLNPGYLLTQLFTTRDNDWDKIVYLFQLLLPLGLLPFCNKKPSRWLLLAPMLLNLLTYYPYQSVIRYQYSFGISAFLIYAAIQNIPSINASTAKKLVSIAAAACFCMYFYYVVPSVGSYQKVWNNKATFIEMKEILDELPEDASLNVSGILLAHVYDRDNVYELAYHENKTDVDFVVIDDRYERSEKVQESIDSYLENGYKVYRQHDDLLLILRKSKMTN